MDLDISRWILDFILRQPSLDDMTLDKLLRVLPLPVEDPSFKKALLVRSIVSEISKGVASEEMLVLMEHIEELDYQAGVAASQALKTAYCDVAVDLTARLLEGSQGNYSEAVNRIWGQRVGLMMEREDIMGLLSDELRSWKYDIEASVERVDDSSLFSEDDDDLLKKWRGTSYETLKSLRVYVEEAWANMGPSFLEQVARIVGSEQIRKVLYPMDHHQDQQHRCGIKDEVAAAGKLSAEMVKRSRILHPRRKWSRGAKLSSDIADEMDESSVKKTVESPVNDDPPPGEKEVIDLELENENVIDLELENVIDLEIENGDGNDASTKKNESVIDLEIENGNDASTKKNENENENVIDLELGSGNVNDTSKRKKGNENDCGRRVLPASHVYSCCPLKRKDMNLQNGMRRRRKFWSNLEEDTLVDAVKTYGIGNWKFILKQYKDIFEERTEGDLKDKWRNLIR